MAEVFEKGYQTEGSPITVLQAYLSVFARGSVGKFKVSDFDIQKSMLAGALKGPHPHTHTHALTHSHSCTHTARCALLWPSHLRLTRRVLQRVSLCSATHSFCCGWPCESTAL